MILKLCRSSSRTDICQCGIKRHGSTITNYAGLGRIPPHTVMCLGVGWGGLWSIWVMNCAATPWQLYVDCHAQRLPIGEQEDPMAASLCCTHGFHPFPLFSHLWLTHTLTYAGSNLFCTDTFYLLLILLYFLICYFSFTSLASRHCHSRSCSPHPSAYHG